MTPRLRALAGKDAPAVLRVVHAAFSAQEVATDPPSGALKETEETVRALLEEGGGAGLEQGGQLVATALWREKEGGFYLGRLAVLPEHRGRGLARILVAAAEAEARRRGLLRIHVGVRLALPGNRRLFESMGFREFRRVPDPKYGAVVSADLEKHLSPLPV